MKCQANSHPQQLTLDKDHSDCSHTIMSVDTLKGMESRLSTNASLNPDRKHSEKEHTQSSLFFRENPLEGHLFDQKIEEDEDEY